METKLSRCPYCHKGPPTWAMKPDNGYQFYDGYCLDCHVGEYRPEEHLRWAFAELNKHFKPQAKERP